MDILSDASGLSCRNTKGLLLKFKRLDLVQSWKNLVMDTFAQGEAATSGVVAE